MERHQYIAFLYYLSIFLNNSNLALSEYPLEVAFEEITREQLNICSEFRQVFSKPAST